MVSKILIAILLKARIINNCNIFYSNIFQYIFTTIYFFLPLSTGTFRSLLSAERQSQKESGAENKVVKMVHLRCLDITVHLISIRQFFAGNWL